MYIPRFADDDALRERLTGKRVLVAGADGFLGANCAYALHAMGAEVGLVTRQERPRAEIPAKVHRGDLLDRAFAERIVEGYEVVYDFLGFPRVLPSTPEPSEDIDDEFRPHTNLFLACGSAKSNPLMIHTSTRLVYGTPRYLPVDEDHPALASSIYGVHKLAIENYLRVFRQSMALRSVIVRLSSPFGPNNNASREAFGILNLFMSLALSGEPITVYGEGDQERDYIFVDDAMHAYLWAAVTTECENETLNLGGEEGVSIARAAETVARLAGGEVRHVPWPKEAKSVETGSFVSDLSKCRSLLPLRPQLSFEEGIRSTLSHITGRDPSSFSNDRVGRA
ncbi:MAG: NAD-dependent epimerase/dehydratase family protein [Phycisphaeraceae bacterium]|nr:NAD-dependent epimerase/dehydratase family protein [Phycisphaerales bacterium]MCB9842538.1 NAD-dependent epimerase/dehydratase family protein [Phycisphaeraceae bacterium]